MKTTIQSFLLGFALSYATVSFSQVLTPGQAAKFGIDGDLRSDVATQGSFVAAGSHDWFKTAGGTGLGLLNTTGTETYAAKIKAGENFAFTKKMQFPRYSTQDGHLMLDGSYSRDYFGIGPSDVLNDHTVFVANNKESNKNWQNPTTWTTIPAGGTIPNKADIIDTYVHMRRNGTSITGTSFSDLILTVGATTLSTDGDHYIDFEFYKERIQYNATTGLFETPAAANTGGRSPWTFDGNGEIKLFGDITLSFSFNRTTVSNIQLLIWTDYNTFLKGKTARFSFVAGTWNGGNSKGGYGYAQIIPNAATSTQVWGTINLLPTEGPVWGTSSKETGLLSSNYAATTYGAGQFAEAGINLTAFGIDPILSPEKDPCNPPLTRFMVKTRSSSAFSSSLQDFTGPYEFLDAPTPSPKTANPAPITCLQPTITLSPEVPVEGAYYQWTTPNGRIVSGANSSTATVDKAGDYTLAAAAYEGCATTFYTVKVREELYKPKAVASISGTLSTDPFSFVTLKGDTATTTDKTTTSKGVNWKWSGPSGFSAITQNTSTQLAGDYTLTVTETSSGCFSTATARVMAMVTLPVKFTDVSVSTNKQALQNTVSWKLADVREVEKFVAEKSSNGIDFIAAGYVFADNSFTAYSLKDNTTEKTVYYRIKAVAKNGAVTYSSVVRAEGGQVANGFHAYADAAGVITLQYTSAVNEAVDIRVTNMNGQTVKVVSRNMVAGNNTIRLHELTKPSSGVYVIVIQGQTSLSSAKLTW